MDSDAPLRGRAILVVEDEAVIGLWLEQMLIDLGCASVTIAGTVKQALGLIESQKFDAATLDLNLNGLESLPVADALSSRGVPFAFITGYSTDKIDRYSDHVVLTKPIRDADLAAAMSQIIGKG
ncbi:MAG: response regulator [Methylocystis sp.]|uniref:response regulator n=1 Tax=Methylocystis sp. TaxID=1911079 RepID=UPI003DA243E1